MKYLIPVLLLSWTLSSTAATTLFKVIPEEKDTQVEFVSDAPLEKVVGKTRTVTGFVEFDIESAGANARGEIHVDLASIQTGVKLRDRHMRDNHLETDTYPEAVFSLKSLSIPEGGLLTGSRTPATVKGKLSLHGVEREITPQVFLTLMSSADGELLRIEADFTVLLEDYNIERPQFLLLKLSQEQLIQVDILARASSASAQLP